MIELPRAIPDYRMLIALEPEELAVKLLFVLRQRGGTNFHPSNMESELWGDASVGRPGYPQDRQTEITPALVEAWAWLKAQGLVIPQDLSITGQNGWCRLSRRAQGMESEADFASFKTARLLPREILHPKIADPVWRAFMRGEFDGAVFQAMKAVEVAVRQAGGLRDSLLGKALMQEAFKDGGPLADPLAESGEQVGRMNLFMGAISSFKNPQSHRDVNLEKPEEAVEIIMLANHLLRIVDSRKVSRP